MRTVKGNQQTAINRGKIHRYPSLGTGTGFITLRGVGRTPSFDLNMCMNLYLRVCARAWTLASTTRETKKGEFNLLATKRTSKAFLTVSLGAEEYYCATKQAGSRQAEPERCQDPPHSPCEWPGSVLAVCHGAAHTPAASSAWRAASPQNTSL